MDFTNYKTQTALILPFKGNWVVGNGGRDHLINNHIALDGKGPANQTFAYDFIKSHKGKGKNLEDYEAFGQEVVAPGDGIIFQVIDGSNDVPIGESDWDVVGGNMVMINHNNGEYSVLAHFKYQSINVKVGDKVKQGDKLGLCGNTGNTSEPHIHYHLQDNSVMYKSHGLPIQFEKIIVDGKIKNKIELERDQQVCNIKLAKVK